MAKVGGNMSLETRDKALCSRNMNPPQRHTFTEPFISLLIFVRTDKGDRIFVNLFLAEAWHIYNSELIQRYLTGNK